jgi:hypothetical protein
VENAITFVLTITKQNNIMTTQNNITDIRVRRTSSYGRYIISGIVNGEEIETYSNDSETFDRYNDDSDLEKQAEAIQHCEMRLQMAYERKLD